MPDQKTVPRKKTRWLVKNRVSITRWRHRTSSSCWRNDGASKENFNFDNLQENKSYPSFSSWFFLKEIKNMLSVLLSSYRNTSGSLREREMLWICGNMRQENTSRLTYPLTKMCWGGGMVSIIFIHLGFWMGQQPSIPEGSWQVLVPSGHWWSSSGDKTLPEMPMKPFLLKSVSTCCEVLPQHKYIQGTNGLQHCVSSGQCRPSGHIICNKD